jgi:hypothetical protein
MLRRREQELRVGKRFAGSVNERIVPSDAVVGALQGIVVDVKESRVVQRVKKSEIAEICIT